MIPRDIVEKHFNRCEPAREAKSGGCRENEADLQIRRESCAIVSVVPAINRIIGGKSRGKGAKRLCDCELLVSSNLVGAADAKDGGVRLAMENLLTADEAMQNTDPTDEVAQLMLNAELRDQLEPFLDESLDLLNVRRQTEQVVVQAAIEQLRIGR